jgi:hypothetical protein
MMKLLLFALSGWGGGVQGTDGGGVIQPIYNVRLFRIGIANHPRYIEYMLIKMKKKGSGSS